MSKTDLDAVAQLPKSVPFRVTNINWIVAETIRDHPIAIESQIMPKPKRKLTAAQRRAKRERKLKFMTIFINGKQKTVPRPKLIDGMPEDEYILRNADPMWLHMNEMWEYIPIDDADPSS